jgi:hypothetical protein
MKERKHEIESVRENDLTCFTEQAFDTGFAMGFFAKQIQQFEEESNCNKLSCSSGINLRGATRDELMLFLKIFGGKWNKEVNTYYPDKIDYHQTIPHPFIVNDFITIKATMAEPPPSCKIVEVEEMVPGSIRKVRKMVCPEPTKDEAPEVVKEVKVEEEI